MGIENETGSLKVGKWADFAVVETMLESERPEPEILEAAADGGVVATVVGGKSIYNRIEDGIG